jgi:hypothetical protein
LESPLSIYIRPRSLNIFRTAVLIAVVQGVLMIIGKSLIFLAFVLTAAVVFVFRHLSIGVKKALDWNSGMTGHQRLDHSHLLEDATLDGNLKNAIVRISELLASQLMRSGFDSDLPPSTTDMFSRGYIGGFAGVLLRSIRTFDDRAEFAAIRFVFTEIFGQIEGASLALQFLNDQPELTLQQGMVTGAHEAKSFLKDTTFLPSEWTKHIRAKSGE